MSLNCEVLLDPEIEFVPLDLLANLIEYAAEQEPVLGNGPWQMSLRLCDDVVISELHDRFFADPTPTDVITFPSGDGEDDGETYLGDVVVSVEAAARQAADAGHSTDREIAFLALHGLLHLCGYDDPTDELRETMHRRQTTLLEMWERSQGRPW
jgi:probable rRNA maturation factor